MGADTEVDTDMEVVMVDEVSEVDSGVDSENKIPICLCLTYFKIVSIYLVIY